MHFWHSLTGRVVFLFSSALEVLMLLREMLPILSKQNKLLIRCFSQLGEAVE